MWRKSRGNYRVWHFPEHTKYAFFYSCAFGEYKETICFFGLKSYAEDKQAIICCVVFWSFIEIGPKEKKELHIEKQYLRTHRSYIGNGKIASVCVCGSASTCHCVWVCLNLFALWCVASSYSHYIQFHRLHHTIGSAHVVLRPILMHTFTFIILNEWCSNFARARSQY